MPAKAKCRAIRDHRLPIDLDVTTSYDGTDQDRQHLPNAQGPSRAVVRFPCLPEDERYVVRMTDGSQSDETVNVSALLAAFLVFGVAGLLISLVKVEWGYMLAFSAMIGVSGIALRWVKAG